MKKLLVFILALCMLLSVTVSCKKEPQAPVDTTPAETEEFDPFESKDFEKEEINVLMSSQMGGICYVEDEAANIYQEEILEAYLSTEDKYNVIFNVELESGNSGNAANFTKKIEMGYNSGIGNGYDYIIGQSLYAYPLAYQGFYQNIYKSEYIDLTSDYYYHDMNDNLTVANQIYGIAGAYNMDKISMQTIVFYNKTIHESHFTDSEYENLYDIVRAGNWTLATMAAMAQEAQLENGDSVWDNSDQYGFIGVNGSVAAVISSGVEGVNKNDEGEYTLTFYNERLVNLVKDWGDFFSNDYVLNDGTYDNESVFTSGHSLFYSSHLSTLSRMRGVSDFNIGVLPFPKYDTTQTEYRTYVNRSELIYIPSNANAEISGTIVEYMNYQFHKNVVPAYWDISMQGRYAAAPEDREMMILARNGVYEDFAYAYRQDLGDFYVKPQGLILQRADVAGWWQGVAESTQANLDNLIAKFQELETKGY